MASDGAVTAAMRWLVSNGVYKVMFGRVKPITVGTYKKRVREFCEFLRQQGWVAWTSIELDLFLAVFLSLPRISNSKAQATLAGVEFFLPTVKGSLDYSHAVTTAKAKQHPPTHALPMPFELVLIFAVWLSYMGQPRLGIMVLVQWSRGLRPNEMLRLRGNDCQISQLRGSKESPVPPFVLNLGVKTGTKVGRPQAVIVPFKSEGEECNIAWQGLHTLSLATAPGELMAGNINLAKYNKLLKQFCEHFHINAFTPHGLRAGWASTMMLKGVERSVIKSVGRWASDNSLACYLDIIAVAASASNGDIKRLAHIWEPMRMNFWGHFCTRCPGGIKKSPPYYLKIFLYLILRLRSVADITAFVHLPEPAVYVTLS